MRPRDLALAIPLVMLLLILAVGCSGETTPAVDTSWIDYPDARRDEVVDLYHGVEVPDPYRWLEDEASAETQGWLSEQDAIAGQLFDMLPARQQATDYLERNWLDGVLMVPVRREDKTFFFRAEGQTHNVLYLQRGDGEPEAIFDLNRRDPDGELSTRTTINVSPKGRYVTYPIHRSGADAAEIRIYDTEAGRELDEVLPTAFVFVTDWLPDESGFFYTWVDMSTLMGQTSDKEPGIYRHRIGTPIDSDQLVYRRSWDGQYMAMAMVADDEKHLLVQDMNIMGSRGGWGVRPLDGGPDTPVRWLIEPRIDARFAYVGSSGSELFLVTDHESPNWRVVAIDLEEPGIDNLREVVAESEEPLSMMAGTNTGVVLHDDTLYATYIQHNSNAIRIYDTDGTSMGEIALPELATVSGIGAKKDDPVLHIGLQSFLVPQSIYAYETGEGSLTPVESVETPAEFDDYDVERVFYASYDGTEIPMSIVRRKDAPRDGKDKVLLYGYGGWGIPWLPRFENRIHAWLHMGGTYVLANIRGGGEYGDGWHQAGQFMNKQDVFDDFHAAAEYLVDEGITTPSRITILGGSNGGLLTAASYNQRPELFGAVISEVAAVDMLRIQDTPVGATVTHELGHPNQSPEMFEYLKAYSPLHNVRQEGPYPPILHMVGENDPRCKPGHIYKYVAEMQRQDDPERLAVLRLIRGAGHGSHRREEQIDWYADELAWAWTMTE